MFKLLKNILGRVQGKEELEHPPLKSTSAPTWNAEVVVHPQYWIESNFTLVEKMLPLLVPFMSKALEAGHITDIARETAQDSINLLQESIVIQLKTHVSPTDGAWSLKGADNRINLVVRAKREEVLQSAIDAWENTKKVVTSHGLKLQDVEEDWDRVQLTGDVRIPTAKLQLDISSTLLWNVLHRNKNRTILWKHKIWLPK